MPKLPHPHGHPHLASSPIGFASSFAALACCGLLLACGDDGGGAGTGSGAGAGAGGGAGAGSGGGAGALDACSIVTQADATALFGQPAVPELPDSIVDPGLLGECLWTWDTDLSNQLLQFYVWDGAEYHSTAPDGAEPLPVGEQGYLSVDESWGIDAEWVQDDRTIVLSYFNIGPEAPALATMVEPMKALAQKVSSAL